MFVFADLRASIAVFLVALPLALGVAVASGLPPVAGILTSVVGGLVVGVLSGSPLQVSGATAGLSILIFDGVQRFGIHALGVAIVLAGMMQIIAGLLRTGEQIRFISRPVIQGLIVGLGALIVFGQLITVFDNNSLLLLTIGVGVMVGWPKVARGPLRFLPAPLIAIVTGAVLVNALGLKVVMIEIPNALHIVSPTWDGALEILYRWDIYLLAMQIAFIASAETLISALAIDKLRSGPRAQLNRELIAQGLGNTICGLIGALPMSGVVVRSTTNVIAGAKTRLSTIFHGGWILVFVLLFPQLFNLVPIATLSGILVVIGGKLLGEGNMRHLYKNSRYDLIVVVATATMVFSYNLLAGIVLGMILAGLKQTTLARSKAILTQVERSLSDA